MAIDIRSVSGLFFDSLLQLGFHAVEIGLSLLQILNCFAQNRLCLGTSASTKTKPLVSDIGANHLPALFECNSRYCGGNERHR